VEEANRSTDEYVRGQQALQEEQERRTREALQQMEMIKMNTAQGKAELDVLLREKETQQHLELEQIKALSEMRTEVEVYQRKEKERKDMLERLAKAKAQQEKRQVSLVCGCCVGVWV
jgi:hypothetical protein